jgi:hypothetical protein
VNHSNKKKHFQVICLGSAEKWRNWATERMGADMTGAELRKPTKPTSSSPLQWGGGCQIFLSLLLSCGPIGDATSGTQPISMEETSYHHEVEMGQIGHMCPRNLAFFLYIQCFAICQNINEEMPQYKKIAKMLIEEFI